MTTKKTRNSYTRTERSIMNTLGAAKCSDKTIVDAVNEHRASQGKEPLDIPESSLRTVRDELSVIDEADDVEALGPYLVGKKPVQHGDSKKYK